MTKVHIPFAKPSISSVEIKEVSNVLKSGWLVSGPKTKEFEDRFKSYIGAKNAVAVNSGTSALFLSLLSCGIKKDDEVITSPYTFVATGNVISHLGAKPVFADIEKNGFNIDPWKIEKNITKKTRAIIPVHFGGSVADMNSINRISKKYNLLVIEDAAHSLGSVYKNGKRVGDSKNITCFSFSATKNITTGEGGMIVTKDDKLAERLRILRYHGINKDNWSRHTRKSWHFDMEYLGYKIAMSDVHAAIGIGQLKRIRYLLKRRKDIAGFYIKRLSKIKNVEIPFRGDNNSYHLFPILVEEQCRDDFIEKMKFEGIAVSVHFIPLHLHKYYQVSYSYKEGDFPNAERMYRKEVSLPIHPSLSYSDIKYITDKIREYFKK